MKMTCYICAINLVILGICAAVFAFTGFDIIKFLSFGKPVIYRSFYAVCGASALFTIYSLIVFKPFKGLK
ncbi:MAG: hypothetical protein HDP34_04840 [Clostridia bacterium]|nr:hypothetical protein [Clostridia bacterium]